MSNGSGLWGTQTPTHPHLIIGPGGIAKEVADVRADLMATFAPLLGIAIEEYTNPPAAVATAIMPVTASQVGSVSYQYAALTGAIGDGAISPPRNIEVVTAGSTATQAPTSVIVSGFDVQGKALTETITGTAGGAATYAGVKCFAKVTEVTFVGGTGTAATMSVGTGIVVGLASTPKTRTGQAVTAGSGALIRRELVDGAVVTSGALTAASTNPPYGAYTPSAAPTTLGPAVVTGSTDITSSGLYGVGGTLAGSGTGLTVILTVNGVGPTTMTFDGTGVTNNASEAAMLAALDVAYPGLVATAVSTHLTLTDVLSGYLNTIVVGSGTANTALGLAAATTHGGGHQYSLEYELDGTKMVDGSFSQ